MFRKFLNRSPARPLTPVAPVAPVAPQSSVAAQPVTPAPLAIPPAEHPPHDFREGWEDRWEASHEVIEGDGGHTDWGVWTEAVDVEKNAFAETELMEEVFPESTVPMPLDPKKA